MKKYNAPKLHVYIIQVENGIASTSNARIGIDSSSNTVDVEDWQFSDGFETNDFVIGSN